MEQLTFNSCMNRHISTPTTRPSPVCVKKKKIG